MTRNRAKPVVLGVADHSGWAILVSLTQENGVPRIADRRRVALIEKGVPDNPYHHETLAMTNAEGERLVSRVKQVVSTCVERELDRLSADLRPAYRVKALAIREPPLPSLPEALAEVHASYYVLCRADGMLYHSAICSAARERRWEVTLFPRGEAAAQAAGALGASPQEVDRWLADRRKILGSPWTREHRDVAAAAIAILAKRSRLQLR